MHPCHVTLMLTSGWQFFSEYPTVLFYLAPKTNIKKSFVYPTCYRVEDEGCSFALPLHLLIAQPPLPYQENFRIRFFITVENRTLLTLFSACCSQRIKYENYPSSSTTRRLSVGGVSTLGSAHCISDILLSNNIPLIIFLVNKFRKVGTEVGDS